MRDDESSDRRSFFAMVLPALLSSLMGGVCSLVMFGGSIGRLAVTLGLSPVGLLVLDRSFIFAKVEEVKKVAALDVELSRVHGIEPRTWLLSEGTLDRASKLRVMNSPCDFVKIHGSCNATGVTALASHLQKAFDCCMRILVGSKQRRNSHIPRLRGQRVKHQSNSRCFQGKNHKASQYRTKIESISASDMQA